MTTALSPTLDKKLSGLTRRAKDVYHSVARNRREPLVVFVVGCQRSGTTMTIQTLEKDWGIKVYPEASELTVAGQTNLRLKPLPEVAQAIRSNGYPVSVIKPLIETQRLPELLESFPNSKAIWKFRHYRDVAVSNLKKFGRDNGIQDIRPMAEGARDNWRSALVPAQVRELIAHHYAPDMNPYDAACLFWLARNELLFTLGMDRNPRVRLLSYERFVSAPAAGLADIYRFIGRRQPSRDMVADVVASSLGTGRSIELSPEIEQHCQSLFERMRALEAAAA